MIGTGRGAAVARWLEDLPDGVVEAEPALALGRAVAALTASDGPTMRLWLDIARRNQPSTRLPDGTSLEATAAALDALAGRGGVAAMRASADRALAGDVMPAIRLLARYLRGTALELLDDRDGAWSELEALIEPALALPPVAVMTLAQLSLSAAFDGDWRRAGQTVERGLALRRHYRFQHLPFQGMIVAAAALVAGHQGDAVAARRLAADARTLIGRINDMAPWGWPRPAWPWPGHTWPSATGLPRPSSRARRARALRDVPDAWTLVTRLKALDQELLSGPGTQAGPEALTTAELRLLALLPTHLTYAQIAETLHVSVNTVKSQARSVYRKLAADSRHRAVARAAELGMLRP